MYNIFNNKNLSQLTLNPYLFRTNSVNRTGVITLIFLAPQLLMLCITNSWISFLICCLTVLASFLADLCYFRFSEKVLQNIVITVNRGIILGLLIPSEYPPVAVFVVSFIVLLLIKYSFGGFAGSWVNPIAITVAILYVLNSSVFPAFLLNEFDIQSRNPALILIQNGTIPIKSFDPGITSFLNKTIFKLFGIVIPDGYVSLFWDNGLSIPAFRFNLITLISSICLLSFEVVDYIIPTIFIVLYGLLVRFVLPFFIGAPIAQGDVILAMLTSGTLFSTLFLLQWFGTIPMTVMGKVFFGGIAGIVAFLILGFGTSSCGYIFLILVMNVISPIIQYFEDKKVDRIVKKTLIPRVNQIESEV